MDVLVKQSYIENVWHILKLKQASLSYLILI